MGLRGQQQHSGCWVVSSIQQLFSVSLTGKGRRSNKRGILQAKSELWATNWTMLLYLTKSGFLLSVQELPDAKTCARSGIAEIRCVWDMFNLLCKLSTDDTLIHSLPDGFQTCWNYNHWDICDTAHLRYSHTACKSESACLGGNIWDFLLSREISRMFNYLEDKISRWKIRDLFREEHSSPPQVNSCPLPSISGKDSFKIPQQFSLWIYLLLPIISTLLEHCGGQLWWKKCNWQSLLT